MSSVVFVHREGTHINVYGGLSKTQKNGKVYYFLGKYLVLLTKVEYTYDTAISLLGKYQQNANICSSNFISTNVHNSTIHNSKKLETT